MSACPTGALYLNDKGILKLKEEKCIKCGVCLKTCPYHAIFQNPMDGTPLICDLCDGKALCVTKCPTNTLSLYPLTEISINGMGNLGEHYKLAFSEYKKLLERWGIHAKSKRVYGYAGKLLRINPSTKEFKISELEGKLEELDLKDVLEELNRKELLHN